MSVRFSLSRGLVLTALVLVGACSDRPVATAPARAAVAGIPGSDPLYPNTHHYREQGYVHGTGRAGNAVLTARALLGEDGNVAVEATTGQLDVPDAPGSLKKVQVKLLTADGQLQRTLNYVGLAAGGTFSANFPARPRSSFVQLQANVDGIDRRTDVVTVMERVNLRPDIAVQGVQVPSVVSVDDKVFITANLAELNGDVGATVACVLRVNGEAVDRIPNVWLAEGDAGTCVFKRNFPDPGTYTVDVAVEDVVPGDWDLGNNHASATLEAVGGERALHGSASFSGWFTTDSISQSDETLVGNGSHNNNVTVQVTKSASQSGVLTATAGPLTPPLAAGSTVSIVSDGGTALTFDLTGLDRTPGDPTCGLRLTAADQVVLCFGTLSTSVNVSHTSGRATYYSLTVYEYWDAGGTYYHSEDPGSQPASSLSSGLLPDVGAAVTYHVHLVDAKTAWGADPTVPIASSVQNQLTPSPCSVADDGWIWEQTCLYESWVKRTYGGSVSF